MATKPTTFKEVIETYYKFSRNLIDWNDFFDAVGNFVSSVLSDSQNTYLKSLNRNQVYSLCERLAIIIDGFPSAFPYGESNSYSSQVNKLDNQAHLDGYYSLWHNSNKIELGTFYPNGINGPRKDITTTVYLDSTNANLLVDTKTMTRGQEKVARFCFADCYELYIKRPKSCFIQAIQNDIENIIFTDRFDPFHASRDSKDNHTNLFPKHSGKEQLELFQRYFTPSAKTPHLHFYYESVCSGDVLPSTDGRTPKGNDKSLAINLGNLSQYINDLCKEIKNYDTSKPIPAILANDLGMPYLSILYGSTSFDKSYFVSKVKRLPNLSDDVKQDILGKLSATRFLKLNLQFFAESKNGLPDFPKEPPQRTVALKQLKQLLIAYKFINDYAEVLTPGEQRSLISAINDGLNSHITLKNTNNNENRDEKDREDDFEPIL